MYRHFLPTYRYNAIRGEAWIRAPRSHKHTDMREFTRFRRLAKISAIDVGARVVHSRSSINTRGFCKANQSQLFFTSAYTHSLSLSFSLYYSVARCAHVKLMSIHGDPVTITIEKSFKNRWAV